MEGSKVCTKCGVEKSLEEFYNDKKNRDGKHSHCKGCKHECLIRYRNQNRYEINKKRRQKRLKESENPERLKKIRRLRSLNTETHRCCTKCGELRPNSSFRKRKKTYKQSEYTYYGSWCEVCRLKYGERYRKSNRRQINIRQALDRQLIKEGYVKRIIVSQTGIEKSEINSELIELKTQLILLHRANKELKELQDKSNQ